MDVSVVIPVFNKQTYVCRCLESVLSQRAAPEYEVIVVDDGSTDGSPAICDEMAKQAPRLKVIHTPNAGVTAARKLGVSHATGQYVTFLDADDKLLPDALNIMFAAATSTGADEVIARYENQHGQQSPVVEGNPAPEEIVKSILRNNHRVPVLWATLIRREMLEGCLDAPREIIEGEDKLMQIAVLLKKPKLVYCPRVVYAYTQDVPNTRRHTLELAILRDKELERMLGERMAEFRDDFTVHQLKDYELLLSKDINDLRKHYRNALRGRLNASVPLLDRIALLLPEPVAKWAVRARKKFAPSL